MLIQSLKKVIPTLACILFFGTSYGQMNVWPGDINNNGQVSHVDLLYLGATYGLMGPERDSISINWEAKNTSGWFSFLNIIDAAFADCNGDGMVFEDDILAIEQNFGLTHGSILLDTFNTESLPDTTEMTLNINDNFGPVTEVVSDSTYRIDLNLGSGQMDSLTNFYGIAFTVVFEENWCQPTNVNNNFFDINDTWISNNPNTEILKVENWDGVNRLRVAMTRTDGMSIGGFGKIGDFNIVIEGNVPTFTSNEPIMRVEEIFIVDELLNIDLWTEGHLETDIISKLETSSFESRLSIYPNPTSNGIVAFEGVLSEKIESIHAYDVLGRKVSISTKENQIKFNEDFNGVVFLRINTKNGLVTKQLVITQ